MARGHAPFFTDLPESAPSYKYAQALANAGYSVGYDDKTFKPDKPLTREEMIGIKVGVDRGKAIPPEPTGNGPTWNFSDWAKVDKRYTGYIYMDNFGYNDGSDPNLPSHSNIIRSFGKIGTFNPKQAVLRSEAAASLWQVDTSGWATGKTAKDRIKEEQEKAAAEAAQ